MHISMHTFLSKHLLIAVWKRRCTGHFVLCPGEGRRWGCLCVCVYIIFFFLSRPPLQHPCYKRKKNPHRPSFRCGSRCHGNWRAKSYRDNTVHGWEKKIKHTAIAHEIQRCVMIHIGVIKASGAQKSPPPQTLLFARFI